MTADFQTDYLADAVNIQNLVNRVFAVVKRQEPHIGCCAM